MEPWVWSFTEPAPLGYHMIFMVYFGLGFSISWIICAAFVIYVPPLGMEVYSAGYVCLNIPTMIPQPFVILLLLT